MSSHEPRSSADRQAEPPSAEEPIPTAGARPIRQVRKRTTPKLLPFFILAVALAFTAAIITVYSTEPAENYTNAASLGYMTFFYAIPAVVVAATAWLITEKVLRKRATTVEIQRVDSEQDSGETPTDHGTQESEAARGE